VERPAVGRLHVERLVVLVAPDVGDPAGDVVGEPDVVADARAGDLLEGVDALGQDLGVAGVELGERGHRGFPSVSCW
jgi:hypothetical protein